MTETLTPAAQAPRVQPWSARVSGGMEVQLTPRHAAPISDDIVLGVATPRDGVSVLIETDGVPPILQFLRTPKSAPHQWREGQCSGRLTHLDGAAVQIEVWWNGSKRGRTGALAAADAASMATWLTGWLTTSWTPALLEQRRRAQSAPPPAPSPLTTVEQIDALTEALTRLTHRPTGYPNPCIDDGCSLHQDAAVHWTPERVLRTDTCFGTPDSDTLDKAQVVIATAMRVVEHKEHPGWGHYAPAARKAALDLIAAGWGPVAASDPSAAAALTALSTLLRRQEMRHEANGEVLQARDAEIEALEGFRRLVLGAAMQMRDQVGAEAAAQAAGKEVPPLTRKSILAFLENLQKRGDAAGDRARAKAMKAPAPDIRESWDGRWTDDGQGALFDLSEVTAAAVQTAEATAVTLRGR
jgi:hypothetical protein